MQTNFQYAIELAQGNPGATVFVMETLKPENTEYALPIAAKLDKIPSLRGTNLYVLWSDLCDRDMFKVALLCELCPDDILADACSRQDYSGRELVKPYLS
jgi:hypothetical protein